MVIIPRHPDTITVYEPNLGYDPDYSVLWTFYLHPLFTPGNQCSVYRIQKM